MNANPQSSLNQYIDEAETRRKLIDPILEKAGWRESDISREFCYKANHEFKEGRVNIKTAKREKPKRCDYLLYMPASQTPLAVFEAKSKDKAANQGLEQAKDYAKDLHAPFAFASNGIGVVEYDFFTKKTREFRLKDFPSPSELKRRLYTNKAYTQEQIALLETPYFLDKKTPRYYQANAINTTIEAIAKGQKRILLEMATGTGKTYTAFQIAYRLHRAKLAKRILFLTDRVNLIEQSERGDFADFKGKFIIKHRRVSHAYEMYFSTYQQLIEGGGEQVLVEHYKKMFKSDFFDLIIIDECHRSSRKDEGAWKAILHYFESAIHIGLTATPINKIDGDNVKYFCSQNDEKPHFTYSLQQGIDDGFLAPYKVVRYSLNINREGVSIPKGKRDIYGYPIDEELVRTYYSNDFNKKIRIKEHIDLVAREITNFLKNSLKNRKVKTIVFCQDQEHAADIKDALNNYNADLGIDNYAACITSNQGELGKNFLEDFLDIRKDIPVIATTSKLLTTGVDSKMTQLIVIAQSISSPSELMQIIGRGTRLSQDLEALGKSYFVILDFTDATRLFGLKEESNKTFPKIERKPPKPRKNLRVDGIEVYVDSIKEEILDDDGKLISNDFVLFTKDNLAKHYDLQGFLKKWQESELKGNLITELENQGILIKELRTMSQFENLDEFDILLKIAFDRATLTRRERAARVGKMLEKYEGKAREILEFLLDEYTKEGIEEIENTNVFTNEPLNFLNAQQAMKHFGGEQNYLKTMKELKALLYSEVA